MAPTSRSAPQPVQRPDAVVRSRPKTVSSKPAIAFPSTWVMSRASEPFRTDAMGRMSQPYERLGHGLDEACRAAHVDGWILVRRERNFLQQLAVDAARVAGPPRRLRARHGVHDLDSGVARAQLLELVPVDHVPERARRIEQPCRHGRSRGGAIAKHR